MKKLLSTLALIALLSGCIFADRSFAKTDPWNVDYADIFPTPTFTPTVTNTFTPTISYTSTISYTPTASYTWTPTLSNTPIFTATFTLSNTPVYTATKTYTPTNTPLSWNGTVTTSYTPTATYTPTKTYTPTQILSNTPIYTATFTLSNTPIYTATNTNTPTVTYTPTVAYMLTPSLYGWQTFANSSVVQFHFQDRSTAGLNVPVPAPYCGTVRINWLDSDSGYITVGGRSFPSATTFTPIFYCGVAGPYSFHNPGFQGLYLKFNNTVSDTGWADGYITFSNTDDGVQYVQKGFYQVPKQAPTTYMSFGPITNTGPTTLIFPEPTPTRWELMGYRITTSGATAAATPTDLQINLFDTYYPANIGCGDSVSIPSTAHTTGGMLSDTGYISLGDAGYQGHQGASSALAVTLSSPVTSGGVYIWLQVAETQYVPN
jgi:hypothetical protein